MTTKSPTIYLALMPGKRKPRTIASSALAFYKERARLVWRFEGSAEAAREAIARGALPSIGGTDHREPPAGGGKDGASGALVEVTFTRAPHAALEAIFDPRVGRHVVVGTRMGDYAREDAGGVEYRCLGEDDTHRGVSHSRDYKPGFFYPANVFATGRDENGESLTHEQLRRILVKLGYGRGSTRPIWLPRGYKAGAPTFEAALVFTPIELAPALDHLERRALGHFAGVTATREGRWVSLSGRGLL